MSYMLGCSTDHTDKEWILLFENSLLHSGQLQTQNVANNDLELIALASTFQVLGVTGMCHYDWFMWRC